MAIEHLVIMKLCNAVSEEEIQALYRECEAHFEKIPGVVSVSMGANLRAKASFTHALVIRFEALKALEAFKADPNHVAAGKRMQEVFCEFVIVDYETERN